MEPVLNSAMCRCCASEGTFKDIHTRYHWMGDEEVYSVMLKECFDITLSSPQGDEGGICEVCITQLRNAFNFKKQVLHTEEQFQHLLPNKVQEIKMEYTKDSSEEPEDRPVSAADNSDSDFTPSIKEEDDEALESKSKTKKRAVKSTAARSKKPKLEAPETSTQSLHRISISPSILAKLTTEGSVKVRWSRAAISRLKPSNVTEKNPVVHDVPNQGSSRVKLAQRTQVSRILEKMRHNTLKLFECTNATAIRRHDGVKYSCAFCSEAFVAPKELKYHTLAIHENDDKTGFLRERGLAEYIVKVDITSLQCKLCNLACETVEDVFEHLAEAHDVVIYKDVNSQILPFKFTDENLTCFVCQNCSTSFKMLLMHMVTHYGSHYCDICSKRFLNTRTLASHRQSHCSGVFECEKCEKIFDTAGKRKLHTVRVHTKPNLYKCGFCGVKFASYDEKRNHMVADHDMPSHAFKCHACEKVFRKAYQLTLHVKKYHLLERNHVCPDCGKAFFAVRYLREHMTMHDPHAPKIVCSLCDKSFKYKKSFQAHMRIHLDDRRFKCDQCGMSFIHNVSWRSHMKSKHDVIIPVRPHGRIRVKPASDQE